MNKIYLVGHTFYYPSKKDLPNFDSFPAKVYINLDRAEKAFEELSSECVGEHKFPYLIEKVEGSDEFKVLKGVSPYAVGFVFKLVKVKA